MDTVHNSAGYRTLHCVRGAHFRLPKHDSNHTQTGQGEIIVKWNCALGLKTVASLDCDYCGQISG